MNRQNKPREETGYDAAPKHQTYKPMKTYSPKESPLKQWWIEQQERKEKDNAG